MSTLTWDSSYSVGVELLDGQHQLLFQIINRFYNSMERNDPSEQQERYFHEVLDYTEMHFRIEETFMKQAQFPDLEAHIGVHKKLLDEATELDTSLKAGTPGAGEKAVQFLKDWLEKHIKGMDTKYTPFMHEAKIA